MDVPLSQHCLAQERQGCIAKIGERRMTSGVIDAIVYQSPQPFDRVEM